MKKNIVRQIKVQKLLGDMLAENKELYEKILDSNISFFFNKITELAMMDSFSSEIDANVFYCLQSIHGNERCSNQCKDCELHQK